MQLYQELPRLIAEAANRIAPHVRRTTLQHSSSFSQRTGCNVYFKCENLQQTGSFKLRGATNKFHSLSPEQKMKGVVAASTGNHGKAVVLTAKNSGSVATVFVPRNAEPTKVEAIRELGGIIELAGNDCVEAELAARDFARRNQATYVSPYNDPAVIAGQGTIGLEICEQLNQVDAVYAAMGGAGLITGIGAYVKSKHPDCQIIGCSPENSQVMLESLQAGKMLDIPSSDTLSDGTAGGVESDSITFELCQELVNQCVSVSEAEIGNSLCRFIETHNMLIEGAAAVAIAGMLKSCQQLHAKNVVVVLCGANIGIEMLRRAIAFGSGSA